MTLSAMDLSALSPEAWAALLFAAGVLAALIGVYLPVRQRFNKHLRLREEESIRADMQWHHKVEQINDRLSQSLSQLDESQAQEKTLQASLLETSKKAAALEARVSGMGALEEKLNTAEERVISLTQEASKLQTALELERKHIEQQQQLLEHSKNELRKEFENTANKIFDHKNQQFSQSSQALLENTLSPFKDQLKDFRKKVEDVYEKENSERNRLSGQIVELQKQAHKISEDAVNLAQALKGSSKTQGGWGEIVLERLLEQSGLQKGREYETQASFTHADGSRRVPDVIIHLPEGKDIVVDSKVSLTHYEKYCNCDDETQRKQYLQQHIHSLRTHIKELSLKDYENLPGINALDFVFIFIPIEAAFMLALQFEPGLYKEAYDKNIILSSPTTLLAILRTVENIWRYEKQNKNAEKIANDAGMLHDQFVLLLEAMDSIGGQLEKTQKAYDLACKRLSTGKGNLLRRVDNIRKLGAKTKKTIDPMRLESDVDCLPNNNEVLD